MRRLLPFRVLLRRPGASISVPLRGRGGGGGGGISASTLHSRDVELRSSSQSGSLGRLSSGLLGLLGRRRDTWKEALATTRPSLAVKLLLKPGLRSLEASLQRGRFDAHRLFSSPQRYWRYLMPTPDGAILSLIGANVAVFFLWRVADYKFMNRHFMISLDNFKSWRLHTLITSAFSHADLDHLVTNMIGLYFFGTNIGRLFGPEFLLKLYLAGALGGSVFFLIHKAYIASSSQGKQGWNYSRTPALGASAAVNAVILLDIFLFPKSTVYVYFMIPVPAILLGALLIGSDLWRIKKGESYVSGSAHLGGAAVAAIVWAGLKKGWI
uniref:Rhomboid protein Panut_PARL n=1 Tax=Pandanus utilis TaxID=101712 RepID=A0A0A7E6U6_9LILI|nr:rhomboid protein Panut_PARL [Pandanus utilis]